MKDIPLRVTKIRMRSSLCEEAIRLARAINHLRGGEPEIMGLLALMLLNDSRRTARQAAEGYFIPLEEQDRSLWDASKIKEGRKLVKQALQKGQAGPFQIQAAISALHAEAKTYEDTDWREISMLYEVLYKLQNNPVILLNRAVAVSYAYSPKDALQLLEGLDVSLKEYQPFHAAKADFFRRAELFSQAAPAYQKAIELCKTPGEQAFLELRLRSVIN